MLRPLHHLIALSEAVDRVLQEPALRAMSRGVSPPLLTPHLRVQNAEEFPL